MYVYDLIHNPPWFDFVTWLMGRATAAQNPFDLTIILNRRPDRIQVSDMTREAMVHTIMLPATRLFPVRHLSVLPASDGLAGEKHDYLATCLRQNKPIPSLKVPDWALDYVERRYPPETVAISLRESSHNSWRNSDLSVWLNVAHELTGMGLHPVLVRDTSAADEVYLHTAWECSHNLYLRAALYQHALMNLGTMNGVCTLATHNTRANYCFHGMGPPVGSWNNANMRKAGYEPDEDRLPWALQGQRVIWEKGTPESVLRDFEATPTAKNDADCFEALS